MEFYFFLTIFQKERRGDSIISPRLIVVILSKIFRDRIEGNICLYVYLTFLSN